MRLLYVVFMALFVFSISTSAYAKNDNILFILDASNSMWGQVDGTAKIDTAKTTFKNLISDIPDNVNIGLAAYGHTSKESCKDVDFLVPLVGKGNRDMLADAVDKIVPKGKTPIAHAVEMLGGTIAEMNKGDNNSIVLISDGIETCGGDPCAIAEKLAKDNIDFKIHVVGFDVSKKAKEQLECIAKKGNGQYFVANSTDGFKKAITDVVKVATEPAPAKEPEKPALKEVFRDDFNGDSLSENWEVVNSDEDSYIVENGKLLIVDRQNRTLASKDYQNLFLLNKELPKGDWVLTARITMPIQTGREQINIGLYKDPSKWIISAIGDINNYPQTLALIAEKRSGDKNTFFERNLYRNGYSVNDGIAAFAKEKMPFDLQLIKEGRKYWAKVTSVTDKKFVFKTEKLTSLRASGKIMIGFNQRESVSGEGNVEIDWIKIESR